MWHASGQSLKELGMDVKLVHQDACLYLISHASLQKRGFAPGMASVIQMLVAQEHRLVIPFSLKNLHCTLSGGDQHAYARATRHRKRVPETERGTQFASSSEPPISTHGQLHVSPDGTGGSHKRGN